ncbi:single-stranded DNA-binding protein [Campylobacter canadensis]|uniref:single-stranded DNA-binding protein n=2 Tax=Campylobacter canadensis TaxID=449520 RepID=UPI001CCF2076|nr:single-stranded DNA-binding protein [Campylobacter canadensis]MBZ7996836.1 single-stranded DNA-binding protein [Campylobacter canadensis]MBZ7999935.1 single-stranded DNA-binding protein [Campylobacter canadensis]MBZ8004496.1 single-stranded DNA-binding protein [Campylobacter canadensis]
MNKVFIIGRLSKDVELKVINSTGSAVVNNTIATSRYRSNNGEKIEETLFIDVVFYSRIAEIVNQYLRKGSKIAVEGFLQQQTWTDQNGQYRSKIQIIVEQLEMLDTKQNDSSNSNSYYQQNNMNANYQNQQNQFATNNYQQNNKSFNNQAPRVQENNQYNLSNATYTKDSDELPF